MLSRRPHSRRENRPRQPPFCGRRYPHRPHSPYEDSLARFACSPSRRAETNQNLCMAFREPARAYWLTVVHAPHPRIKRPSEADGRMPLGHSGEQLARQFLGPPSVTTY